MGHRTNLKPKNLVFVRSGKFRTNAMYFFPANKGGGIPADLD